MVNIKYLHGNLSFQHQQGPAAKGQGSNEKAQDPTGKEAEEDHRQNGQQKIKDQIAPVDAAEAFGSFHRKAPPYYMVRSLRAKGSRNLLPGIG